MRLPLCPQHARALSVCAHARGRRRTRARTDVYAQGGGGATPTSLMMIVPSIASFRSFRLFRRSEITLCILSISCLRNMFIELRCPIFTKRAFTYNKGERAILRKKKIIAHHFSSKRPLPFSFFLFLWRCLPERPNELENTSCRTRLTVKSPIF